jgi:hypothetical protein
MKAGMGVVRTLTTGPGGDINQVSGTAEDDCVPLGSGFNVEDSEGVEGEA